MKKEVLIIDDNQSSLELERFLRNRDYSPIIVDTVEEGLEKINASENLEIVLLSAGLKGRDALKALVRMKSEHPNIIVIVIGAGVKAARKAQPLGALDVLSKNADMETIYSVLGQAFDRLSGHLSIRGETSSISDEESLEEKLEDQHPFVGEDKVIFEVNKAIGRAAHSTVSVLVEGETGTGKGLVALLIHEESERAQKAFVTIDCGAIPSELIENELFGYEPGAFTGARPEGKKGLFEAADGGTLFLDEVGNMPLELQSRLLNVLQTGRGRRVGGTEEYSVDVRIITATNQRLEEMVDHGKFRLDLFHRLCGQRIYLPALRERIEDIPLLTTYFLQRIEEEDSKPMHGISKDVIELFQGYNWPGNIRELENCLKTATVNSQGYVILKQDLPEAILMSGGDGSSEEDAQEMRSAGPLETSLYKNLFDLPVVVFCQFISDAKSGVTDRQIAEWWVEFCSDGRNRANKAEREIGNWLVDWNTCWFSLNLLSERIKGVIDDAISQLSSLRHRTDPNPIEEAKLISIEKRTYEGSLTAVLPEIVKEHGGNKEKVVKELDITLKELERYLSYRTEDNGNDANNSLQTSIQPSRRISLFPYDELIKLLKEPIIVFILENFSYREWQDKELDDQMRAIHLALRVLSERLARNHGYIYFGGMTFSQIKKNIYRRAPYLYTSPDEVTDALDVDVRTFRRHWPKDKSFPSHPTLFTG